MELRAASARPGGPAPLLVAALVAVLLLMVPLPASASRTLQQAATCGTAQYRNSKGVCVACATGKVASPTDPLQCEFCAPGNYSRVILPEKVNATCVPCGTSQFSNGTRPCQNCKAGRVATDDRGSCRKCPAGTAKVPAGSKQANAVCVRCVGTSVIGKGGSCKPCGKGQVANARNTACSFCAAGTVKSPSGGSALNATCVSAAEVCGTAQVANGTGECVTCPTGQVASSNRQSCLDCSDPAAPGGGPGTIKWPASSPNGTCVVDPCLPSPCLNGGVCSMTGPGTYSCNCPRKLATGTNCDVVVCNPSCVNGECVIENGNSTRCMCPPGFAGAACDQRVCTPACANGGSCVARDGGSNVCDCTSTRFTGAACEVPVCSPACTNGGNCTAGVKANTCTCPGLWTGAACEVPACQPACQNKGVCTVTPTGNVCSCTPKWTGPSCADASCNPPCQNGGACQPGGAGSPNFCQCLRDWGGGQCEEPLVFPDVPYGPLLAEHNDYREQLGASALAWSAALAARAGERARSCSVDRDPRDDGNGENVLYIAADGQTPESAFATAPDEWWAERARYVPVELSADNAAPDFTQMVWAATTEVGCAVRLCEDGITANGDYVAEDRAFLVVCKYSPKGNTDGGFASNVLPEAGGCEASAGGCQLLADHNDLRARHSAPALAWDDALRLAAVAAAAPCSLRGDLPAIGQSLYAAVDEAEAWAQAAAAWYATGASYDYANPGPSEAAKEFTQLVWRATTQLGCAVVGCPSGVLGSDSAAAKSLLACRYFMPGNQGTAADYAANVRPANTTPPGTNGTGNGTGNGNGTVPPSCDPPCANGVCAAGNVCRCVGGWSGAACADADASPQPPPAIADAHNQYRALHGAAPAVAWDPDLARAADAWNSQCLYGYEDAGTGENQLYAYASKGDTVESAWAAATAEWYKTSAAYNWEDPGSTPPTAYPFMQVVWRSSAKMGCAARLCPAMAEPPEATNVILVNCRYQPGLLPEVGDPEADYGQLFSDNVSPASAP